MKKPVVILLVVIIVLALALALFSCSGKPQPAAPAQTEPSVTASPAAVQSEATEPPAAPSETEAQPEGTEAQNALLANAAAMLDVMDAGVRALRDAEDGFYDVANADFVWSTLYYFCANTELPEPAKTETDGAKTVPKALMEKLAAACFAEYTALPELPKDASITYDKTADAYTVPPSDKGDDRCEITDVQMTGETTCLVRLALLGTDEARPLLETYAFEMVKGEGTELLYPMRVLSGYAACNVLARVTAVGGSGDQDAEVTLEHMQVYLAAEEGDGESTEAYAMKAEPTGYPEEMLRLAGMEAVDLATVGMLLDGEPVTLTGDEAFAWFKENYARKVEGKDESLLYQLRVYAGTVYSMAPLYGYYFAG